MISDKIIENSVYFDIETAGLYPTLDEVIEKDHHLAELWLKRSKWLAKNVDEDEPKKPHDLWLSKSSLHPEFGRVVCVSFGVFTEGKERITSFYGDNEKEILENTNKILANSRAKGYKLAGQNIKNFDVPYLGKRMLINSIVPDPLIQVWGKKPWETPFLDLGEIFAFGAWGQSFSSLDLMSHVLRVPTSKDNLDGSKVHGHFWGVGKDRFTEIKNYCEQDVVCTMGCFKKLSS